MIDLTELALFDKLAVRSCHSRPWLLFKARQYDFKLLLEILVLATFQLVEHFVIRSGYVVDLYDPLGVLADPDDLGRDDLRGQAAHLALGLLRALRVLHWLCQRHQRVVEAVKQVQVGHLGVPRQVKLKTGAVGVLDLHEDIAFKLASAKVVGVELEVQVELRLIG